MVIWGVISKQTILHPVSASGCEGSECPQALISSGYHHLLPLLDQDVCATHFLLSSVLKPAALGVSPELTLNYVNTIFPFVTPLQCSICATLPSELSSLASCHRLCSSFRRPLLPTHSNYPLNVDAPRGSPPLVFSSFEFTPSLKLPPSHHESQLAPHHLVQTEQGPKHQILMLDVNQIFSLALLCSMSQPSTQSPEPPHFPP